VIKTQGDTQMTSKALVVRTDTPLTNSLDDDLKVVQEIKQLHQEFGIAYKMSVDRAIRIGELLTQQKAKSGHGYFTRWIATYLPFTDRTARNYMKLYENRERLKTENVSVLSEGYKPLSTQSNIIQPDELFTQAKEKILLYIGLLEITNPDDTESMENFNQEYVRYKVNAMSAGHNFLDAVDRYRTDLEATQDTTVMIKGYAWLSKVTFTISYDFSVARLLDQAVLGGILNAFKKVSPELYTLLEKNHFNLEIMNYLVDAMEKRIAELLQGTGAVSDQGESL
jgi:hypothetical protein